MMSNIEMGIITGILMVISYVIGLVNGKMMF